MQPARKRLGFFTRLLDDVGPGERFRLAMEQIRHAERHGFDSAWVAQHHFDPTEGGLPSPFVFLAAVAARTSAIRLGTGVVTLALEDPLRVAEDAAVLDLLSGGRLEMGLGTGGSATAYAAFGERSEERAAIFTAKLDRLLRAWKGAPLDGGARLSPQAPQLRDRLWQASFSVAGAARAGRAGDGLMLSRTQPRPADAPGLPLAGIQLPMIEAYRAALPPGRAPRILASRSLFVADDRAEALRLAEIGLRRAADRARALNLPFPEGPLESVVAASDLHLGRPEEVIESLRTDAALMQATDIAFQVHSADPPHPYILRSIELIAEKVAPALGWEPAVVVPA
ncbi:putative FMN-dependent luciferase-like monooxygenase [Roseomonas indoligenes]|uniref:FMN-dependent luciferase-like monooxygenase n=1 Tax=Roseomonas indoligenes TaxID=2820811 RepID=A0A940S9V2_9PROT|nr:putative FMN-dependent luciferase-like monooxygenase [Pararoseomonas indoligenes]MBP0495537.1 putative FMN-dependent luciferase-like monooxygenase [Pararoseomonas indoligenes]